MPADWWRIDGVGWGVKNGMWSVTTQGQPPALGGGEAPSRGEGRGLPGGAGRFLVLSVVAKEKCIHVAAASHFN